MKPKHKRKGQFRDIAAVTNKNRPNGPLDPGDSRKGGGMKFRSLLRMFRRRQTH